MRIRSVHSGFDPYLIFDPWQRRVELTGQARIIRGLSLRPQEEEIPVDLFALLEPLLTSSSSKASLDP